MIIPEMQQVFNHLIQVENNSAYLYLAISNYFYRYHLDGFGHWLRVQYHEEHGHALKLVDYLTERGGIVILEALPQQPVDFGTSLQAFEQVLEHERFVTRNYKYAYKIAIKRKDSESIPIIEEFLKEQVEEEAQAEHIVGRLNIINNDYKGLLELDQELGKREPVSIFNE